MRHMMSVGTWTRLSAVPVRSLYRRRTPGSGSAEAMDRSLFLLGGRRRVAVRAVHGGSLDRSKWGPENLSVNVALGKLS